METNPPGWLWTGVNPLFTNLIKTNVETYFYDRFINSIKDENFKRFFTIYANTYEKTFMDKYEIYVKSIDPITARQYHEQYDNTTTRDNRHNTTTTNKQTNNLTNDSTRTDNLHTVTNNNVTREDNLSQLNSHTGTVDIEHNDMNERTDNLSQTTDTNTKNLHSDMPQSNVADSTTGFPNVTWTYASDMQDQKNQSTTHNTGNQSNDSHGNNTTTYNDDVDISNTGTQNITTDTSTDNTGTQQNIAKNTGTIDNNGTNNLTIDDNEHNQGTRDIKEQNQTETDLYEKYFSYLDNSNVWTWLYKKLDVCFLSILSMEDEDYYEPGYC